MPTLVDGIFLRASLVLYEKIWIQANETGAHNHRGVESWASELISFRRKLGKMLRWGQARIPEGGRNCYRLRGKNWDKSLCDWLGWVQTSVSSARDLAVQSCTS